MLKSLLALFMMAMFALVAFRSHFGAMAMYWWYAIFRPQEWMWWDVSRFRFPLVAAAVFLGHSLIRRRFPKPDDAIKKLMIVFAFVTIIAQITSKCQSYYALSYDFILILVGGTLLTSALITSFARLAFLVLFIAVIFSFSVGTIGITTALAGGTMYDRDVGGGGISGSNAVGLASAMCFFLLIPFVKYSVWRKSDALPKNMCNSFIGLLVILIVCFSLVALVSYIYVSDSRGSAIALAVGSLVWILLQERRYVWICVFVLVASVVIGTGVIPKSYVNRLSTVFVEEEDLDGSAASRPHFWSVATDMAFDNPLGVGAGCYMNEYEHYDTSGGQYGVRRSVHSSHFGIFAELGFFGLAIWILLHFYVIKSLFRVRRLALVESNDLQALRNKCVVGLINGLIASHLAFLVGGSFYEFSYNDITWLTFIFASSALSLSLRLEGDQEVDFVPLKPKPNPRD